MYAFSACTSKSSAQNAANRINVVSTSLTLILSSTLRQLYGLQVAKLFVHLFSMKYWYFLFLFFVPSFDIHIEYCPVDNSN